MKHKLELKHLAPYLPYGLKFYIEDLRSHVKPFSWTLGVETNLGEVLENQNKPILRPLSDLTKGELEEFYNSDKIEKGTLEILKKKSANWYETIWDIRFKHNEGIGIEKDGLCYTSFGIGFHAKYTQEQWEWFYSKHLDVFGLIEKGLAIDINTLKP